MSKQIKVTDLVTITGQAALDIGTKVGIKVSIEKLNSEEHLPTLAMIGGLLRQLVEGISDEKIGVVNQ
jgi:hypothetical protein